MTSPTIWLILATLLSGYHLIAAEKLHNITVKDNEQFCACNESTCVIQQNNISFVSSADSSFFCVVRNGSLVCCTEPDYKTLNNCTSPANVSNCQLLMVTSNSSTTNTPNITTSEKADCDPQIFDPNCPSILFYGVVVGAPVLLLLIVILVLSICCCKRKKQCCFREKDEEIGNQPPSTEELELKTSSTKSLKRRGTRPNSYVKGNSQHALIPSDADYDHLPPNNATATEQQEDYENVTTPIGNAGYVNAPNTPLTHVEPSEYEEQEPYGNWEMINANKAASQVNEQEPYMDMQGGSSASPSSKQEPEQENYEVPETPVQEDYETPTAAHDENPPAIANHQLSLVEQLKILKEKHKKRATEKQRQPSVEPRVEEYDYTSAVNVTIQPSTGTLPEEMYDDRIQQPINDENDDEIYQNATAIGLNSSLRY